MTQPIDDSFHLAAMCGLKGPTPYVRRTRKPWTPREPIQILEFEEANDEEPGDDSDRRDADVLVRGSEMAEGGE